MQEINDELMVPCAQCCRKHLSAAIAYYAELDKPVVNDALRFGLDLVGSVADGIEESARVLVARAIINMSESDVGYASHRTYALGLLVRAEEAACSIRLKRSIRDFRVNITPGSPMASNDTCSHVVVSLDFDLPSVYRPGYHDWYLAHVAEAEREYPEIVKAVDRNKFYRDNMSEQELRQAEVNYRLAQLRWLDENVFGLKPKEKGEEEMACGKKPAKAPVKAAAKKAACKGGKCKK